MTRKRGHSPSLLDAEYYRTWQGEERLENNSTDTLNQLHRSNDEPGPSEQISSVADDDVLIIKVVEKPSRKNLLDVNYSTKSTTTEPSPRMDIPQMSDPFEDSSRTQSNPSTHLPHLSRGRANNAGSVSSLSQQSSTSSWSQQSLIDAEDDSNMDNGSVRLRRKSKNAEVPVWIPEGRISKQRSQSCTAAEDIVEQQQAVAAEFANAITIDFITSPAPSPVVSDEWNGTTDVAKEQGNKQPRDIQGSFQRTQESANMHSDERSGTPPWFSRPASPHGDRGLVSVDCKKTGSSSTYSDFNEDSWTSPKPQSLLPDSASFRGDRRPSSEDYQKERSGVRNFNYITRTPTHSTPERHWSSSQHQFDKTQTKTSDFYQTTPPPTPESQWLDPRPHSGQHYKDQYHQDGQKGLHGHHGQAFNEGNIARNATIGRNEVQHSNRSDYRSTATRPSRPETYVASASPSQSPKSTQMFSQHVVHNSLASHQHGNGFLPHQVNDKYPNSSHHTKVRGWNGSNKRPKGPGGPSDQNPRHHGSSNHHPIGHSGSSNNHPSGHHSSSYHLQRSPRNPPPSRYEKRYRSRSISRERTRRRSGHRRSHLSRSPVQNRGRSRDRNRSRNPDRSSSPDRNRSCNPDRSSSPDRNRSCNPDRSSSPDRNRSRNPDRSSSPDRNRRRNPDRRGSSDRNRSRSRSHRRSGGASYDSGKYDQNNRNPHPDPKHLTSKNSEEPCPSNKESNESRKCSLDSNLDSPGRKCSPNDEQEKITDADLSFDWKKKAPNWKTAEELISILKTCTVDNCNIKFNNRKDTMRHMREDHAMRRCNVCFVPMKNNTQGLLNHYINDHSENECELVKCAFPQCDTRCKFQGMSIHLTTIHFADLENPKSEATVKANTDDVQKNGQNVVKQRLASTKNTSKICTSSVSSYKIAKIVPKQNVKESVSKPDPSKAMLQPFRQEPNQKVVNKPNVLPEKFIKNQSSKLPSVSNKRQLPLPVVENDMKKKKMDRTHKASSSPKAVSSHIASDKPGTSKAKNPSQSRTTDNHTNSTYRRASVGGADIAKSKVTNSQPNLNTSSTPRSGTSANTDGVEAKMTEGTGGSLKTFRIPKKKKPE